MLLEQMNLHMKRVHKNETRNKSNTKVIQKVRAGWGGVSGERANKVSYNQNINQYITFSK